MDRDNDGLELYGSEEKILGGAIWMMPWEKEAAIGRANRSEDGVVINSAISVFSITSTHSVRF